MDGVSITIYNQTVGFPSPQLSICGDFKLSSGFRMLIYLSILWMNSFTIKKNWTQWEYLITMQYSFVSTLKLYKEAKQGSTFHKTQRTW